MTNLLQAARLVSRNAKRAGLRREDRRALYDLKARLVEELHADGTITPSNVSAAAWPFGDALLRSCGLLAFRLSAGDPVEAWADFGLSDPPTEAELRGLLFQRMLDFPGDVESVRARWNEDREGLIALRLPLEELGIAPAWTPLEPQMRRGQRDWSELLPWQRHLAHPCADWLVGFDDGFEREGLHLPLLQCGFLPALPAEGRLRSEAPYGTVAGAAETRELAARLADLGLSERHFPGRLRERS